MATLQLTKIDLRAQRKWRYQPSAKEPGEVMVPSMRFLLLDGEGDPNTVPFGEAVAALYAVAYALKSIVRNGPRRSTSRSCRHYERLYRSYDPPRAYV